MCHNPSQISSSTWCWTNEEIRARILQDDPNLEWHSLTFRKYILNVDTTTLIRSYSLWPGGRWVRAYTLRAFSDQACHLYTKYLTPTLLGGPRVRFFSLQHGFTSCSFNRHPAGNINAKPQTVFQCRANVADVGPALIHSCASIDVIPWAHAVNCYCYGLCCLSWKRYCFGDVPNCLIAISFSYTVVRLIFLSQLQWHSQIAVIAHLKCKTLPLFFFSRQSWKIISHRHQLIKVLPLAS